jgi:hypothetical protein
MAHTEDQNLADLRRMIYDMISDYETIFTNPNEKGDIGSILFFYKRLHPERVKTYAIDKLLPHKQKIAEKDLKFFDNNQYIFAGLPEDRIKYYRDEIVIRKRLSDEDMKITWEYLNSMIALIEIINK